VELKRRRLVGLGQWNSAKRLGILFESVRGVLCVPYVYMCGCAGVCVLCRGGVRAFTDVDRDAM